MQFTSTAREDVNRTVTLRHGPDRGKPMTWREASQHPSMFDQENSIDAIIRIVDGKIEYIDTVRPEDPEPWYSDLVGDRFVEGEPGAPTILYDPRPDYRPPQNPILAAFREPKAATIWHFIASLDEPAVWWPNATPDHIEHARKVLTRLANIYKEA